MSGLRVLQLGPLDSPHLRRWCESATATGCEVVAAGHVRRGMAPVQIDDVCAEVRHVGLPTAPSSRGAEGRWGAPGRGLVRGFQLGELPLWGWWARRLAAELRPEVIHAHQLDVWGTAAALARLRPLVVSSWGSDLYLQRGLRALAGRWTAKRADLALAPAPAMAARIGGSARHVDLGVDLDSFRPLGGDERSAARGALGFGEGAVILSFRAPMALYRLELVVDAFELLAKRAAGARLAVAHGPVPLPARLRERMAELARRGRLLILGDVPHERMPEVMAAADAGISIPASDGSPRSVWECLACGTPVVLSALPRLRRRLGEGRGALYAPPRAEALAEAMATAIDDPAVARAARSEGRSWVAAEADERTHRARLRCAYADAAAAAGASAD